MTKIGFQAWLAGACLATAASSVAGVRYTAKDVTPAGALSCVARAVNASGQVVGDVWKSDEGLYAFVTGNDGDQPRLIEAPGWDWTYLVDINDTGVAVGYVRSNQNGVVRHAIVVDPGATTFKDMGTLGGTSATMRAINNKGRLVGYSLMPDGSYQATEAKWPESVLRPVRGMTNAADITDSGVLAGFDHDETVISGRNGQGRTTVDRVNGNLFSTLAMNDKRQLAGYYTDAEGNQLAAATGPNGESPRSLGLPGSSSRAYRIGRDGSVIGEYYVGDGRYSAFIVTPKGRWLDLNRWVRLDDGDALASAHGLNVAGQIAANSETKCYLLTPIPQ